MAVGGSFVSLMVVTAGFLNGSLYGATASDPSGQAAAAALLEAINTAEGESWITLHPEEKLAVFGRHDGSFSNHRIFVTYREEGTWTVPEEAPFSAGQETRAARFSPSGRTLVFSSARPSPVAGSGWNLWQVAYLGDGRWGDAVPLPVPVNSAAPDFHPSVTNSGTLYFGSRRDGGQGNADLYRALPDGDSWVVENIDELNTELSEPDPFVDPDETYMIFARTNAPDGYGGDDLYISYRKDGAWTPPRNLGAAVNSEEYEYGAFVTRDKKLLFFTTYRDGQADIAFVPMNAIGAK